MIIFIVVTKAFWNEAVGRVSIVTGQNFSGEFLLGRTLGGLDSLGLVPGEHLQGLSAPRWHHGHRRVGLLRLVLAR